MKKDDLIELTIEDLGVDGEGIGKVDGMAIFVKDAVPGDRVQAKVMKMKKSYGYARLMQVLDPSPERTESRCAFARQCGGCQLQAMTYEAQLDFKAKKVWNHLIRIGGITDLAKPEIIGMDDPWRYRNKAQFPFGTDKEGNEISLLDVTLSKQEDFAEMISRREDISKVRRLVSTVLSDREKEIITMRYGLSDEQELTQREIGEKLGISRSYVSRIEKKALLTLKKAFEDM